MKNIIKKELNRLVENQIYGEEGISKKIAQLTREIEILVEERKEINKKIAQKTKELKSYESGEISPNQMTMF